MKKRILSFVLLLAMILTMIPVMASAEETNAVVGEGVAGDGTDQSGSQSEEPVDLTDLYVQEGLTALYTTFGEYASTANLSSGKWTDIINGKTATLGETSHWKVGEHGGVGFNIFRGNMEDTDDDGYKETFNKELVDGQNYHNAGIRLNFGIDQLPDSDFTVDYLAMYKPVYIYDADEADKIARDKDGNKLEVYNFDLTATAWHYDYEIDQLGWFTNIASALDGKDQNWSGTTRGATHWMFNNPQWYYGNNGSWLGTDWNGNSGGLSISGNPYHTFGAVRNYAITLDETLTVAEDATRTTTAVFALYRDAALYNKHDSFSTANNAEGVALNKIANDGYFDIDQDWFDSDESGAVDQGFYLSSTRPTDFYTVRIYEVALTDAQRQQNYAVDLLLWYGIELDAAIAADSVKMSAIYSAIAGYTCETDATAKATTKAKIEAIIDGITLTSSENTLYVQDGLTSLFTAFGANNGDGLIKTSTGVTWTNRVAGKHAATFVGSTWEIGTDGGVGRKVIFGTLTTTEAEDGTKTYTYAQHNDRNTYWATTDHKLDIGLDLLPKDDFTVEYLAYYPPMYSVDAATGDLIPTTEVETLVNASASGYYTAPGATSAIDMYPYQVTWVDKIGFLTFITDNPHGHIENQPTGALRPRAENSGCIQWGGTSGNGGDVYGWGDIGFTVDNRNLQRIASYALTRDEVVLEDGKNIEATYAQIYDGAVAKSKKFTTVDGKIANGGTNTGSQYFFGDDDTDFYLSHRIGATYYSLRIYDRVLDATERAQNMMADVIYFYDLSVSDALLADESAHEMLVNVLSSAPFEMDASAKAAMKAELQAEIADIETILEKTNEMTEMYVASENLVALYSVYVPESLNMATGTWTNLVGGASATFDDAQRWSVNENGSVGYTAWVGSIADDGTTNNNNIGNDTAYLGFDGTNHGRRRDAKLNLGLANLPDGDMTVEFMAMSKPVYVADAEESSASAVVYAKDANGDYIHAFNVFGAQYFNSMDYGTPQNIAIDQVGFFGSFSPVTDGAYWGGGRGTVHWMLETSWATDRTWIGNKGVGGYAASSGLNVSGDPFWTVSTIRTYGISIDETVTVDGETSVTSAVLGLYRDGGFYNSNADNPATTTASTYYGTDVEYKATNSGFYLSSARPTDFFTVRVYDRVLTDTEKLLNHMVDLILYYDLELPADFITDEDMMSTLAANIANVPFATDAVMAAAASLQIEDAIQSIYQTSKIYGLYVQDGLVANYTALSPTDTMASIDSGAWANRVAGGASATLGNAQYWRRNANGSVGYDIFYGAVDADGNYTDTSAYNNYSVNGTRLDLGIAQLPKDDFTVEFVAQVNPVYVADANGNIAGETYLLKGSTPGSQQYGAAAYGAVYQMGYFAGFTTNRDGVHGGFTARGGIIWATSATAWNWGNSTSVSGWNNSSTSNTNVFTPNGEIHTYAVQRTEFDETITSTDEEGNETASINGAATYTLLRDISQYATRTLTKADMDSAASKNASYQPVDYNTDDTGYFYLGERISIDYYAVRVYSQALDTQEQAQNHFVDIVLYYGLKLDSRVYTDDEMLAKAVTALLSAKIVTDATTKAANRALYQTRLDNAAAMAEIEAGGDYDSLYVQDGLVGLYTAFADDDSVDLLAGTWTNKVEGGADATIKGTTFWVRNPVGFGYTLTNENFYANATHVGINLPNSYEDLDTFTVEAFAAVVGITDTLGNRYVNNYQEAVKDGEGNVITPAVDRQYGWYMSNTSAFRFGLLTSLFFASLDANVSNQSLSQRWYLMNQAYANSVPTAAQADQVVRVLSYNEDGTPKTVDQYDRAWNKIGTDAIIPSTMQVHKTTTGTDIYYGIFYNGSTTAEVEQTITAEREAELIAATTAEASRFSLFNGLPSDIYAIRVYNRALTPAEKLQNAFVDKVALYNVDITGFEELTDDEKTALYNQFAGISTTMDAERVQAVYDFFAKGDNDAMAETLVSFEQYAPILTKGESGYRVIFSVNMDARDLFEDAGYTVTYGALVAAGGAHNSISDVTVGKSGVKNIVVGGEGGSGIYYRLAGARGYEFTAAVTADTVAELGIDVIVRGYVTLTDAQGKSTTYYTDATENDVLDGEVSVLAATDYFVNKFDGDVVTAYSYINSAALRATLAKAGYTARTSLADDLVLYVNAASGADTNNGQSENTAYATIGAAFEAAKAHLGKTGRKSVVINLADGKYYVTETMTLNADEILADAYSFTVIGNGDTTVLSSEVELDRENLVWDDDTGAAVVQLPADENGEYPALRAVYADGVLVDTAHYGDSENTSKVLAFRIEDGANNTLATTGNDWTLSDADKAKAAYAIFTLPGEMFTADDVEAYVGAEIHLNVQWVSHILHIAKIVENNNGTVSAYVPYGELPELNRTHNFAEGCVWLENALPLLYENGDTVYYDQENGKLYLMEDNIAVADLESYTYASLTKIFVLDGVKNVTFENLAFTGIDSKYITPENSVACGQSAAVTLRYADSSKGTTKIGFQEDSAIFAKNVDGLTVKSISVYDTLSSGVVVKGAGKNIVIDSSRFENLGTSAIHLGDDSYSSAVKNVAITNNYVHNIGTLYKAAVAINITFVADAKIIGNTVTYVPYSAFSIGRIWSTVGSTASNIIQGGSYNTFNVEVAYNYVSDFMMCMQDGGAFYLLGGNIVRSENDKTFYNFMHHNYVNLSHETGRYNGNDDGLRFIMGYYHDNSSSNWLDYENVLINTAKTVAGNENTWFYAYYLQDIEDCEAQNDKLIDNYLIGFDTMSQIFVRDTVVNPDFGISSSDYVYKDAAALKNNTATILDAWGNTETKASPANASTTVAGIFAAAGSTLTPDGIKESGLDWNAPAADREVLMDLEKVDAGSFGATTYTVTYTDGTTTLTSSTLAGATLSIPSVFAQEGKVYTFTVNDDVIDPATYVTPASNVTVNVLVETQKFTVTLKDGATTTELPVPAGETFELPEAYVQEGYKTTLTMDGTNVDLATFEMPAYDVEIRVTYTIGSYTVTFTDGTTTVTHTGVYKTGVPTPTVFVKAGHNAVYSIDGKDIAIKTLTVPGEDTTVNVRYEPASYDVVFYTSEGVAYKTVSTVYGTEIVLPEAPASYEDDEYIYTFAGWTGYTEGMILETEGMSFVAEWTKTSKMIKGDINGDGVVDISDITAVISAASGTELDPEQYPGNTELTGDGVVDISDITAVIAIASGSSAEA